jgi:hypothetical protein
MFCNKCTCGCHCGMNYTPITPSERTYAEDGPKFLAITIGSSILLALSVAAIVVTLIFCPPAALGLVLTGLSMFALLPFIGIVDGSLGLHEACEAGYKPSLECDWNLSIDKILDSITPDEQFKVTNPNLKPQDISANQSK